MGEAFLEGYNGHLEKDEYGNYKVRKEELPAFTELLRDHGVLADPPSQESVKVGVERAKKKIEDGTAGVELSNTPFITGDQRTAIYDSGVKALRFELEDRLYADPKKIVGASSFDSWLGRGKQGQSEVEDRQGRTRTSWEQIRDYSSRDTQLPSLDMTVDMVITDERGAFLVSRNAHRAAAAKLREEPLGFSSIAVYDARGKN